MTDNYKIQDLGLFFFNSLSYEALSTVLRREEKTVKKDH